MVSRNGAFAGSGAALGVERARRLQLAIALGPYLLGPTSADAALRLSAPEREEISREIGADESCRTIARGLGRAPSTVAREIACNGGRQAIEHGLTLRWSPQQILARLVVDFPDDPGMRVSHETIYQSLFVTQQRTSTRSPPSSTAARDRPSVG